MAKSVSRKLPIKNTFIKKFNKTKISQKIKFASQKLRPDLFLTGRPLSKNNARRCYLITRLAIPSLPNSLIKLQQAPPSHSWRPELSLRSKVWCTQWLSQQVGLAGRTQNSCELKNCSSRHAHWLQDPEISNNFKTHFKKMCEIFNNHE